MKERPNVWQQIDDIKARHAELISWLMQRNWALVPTEDGFHLAKRFGPGSRMLPWKEIRALTPKALKAAVLAEMERLEPEKGVRLG